MLGSLPQNMQALHSGVQGLGRVRALLKDDFARVVEGFVSTRAPFQRLPWTLLVERPDFNQKPFLSLRFWDVGNRNQKWLSVLSRFRKPQASSGAILALRRLSSGRSYPNPKPQTLNPKPLNSPKPLNPKPLNP